MQVEYPFAIPRFQLFANSIDPNGCVVASQIKIGSPVWNAGLRPRSIISKVDGKEVKTPGDFYRVANLSAERPVELIVIDTDTGEIVNYSIKPR